MIKSSEAIFDLLRPQASSPFASAEVVLQVIKSKCVHCYCMARPHNYKPLFAQKVQQRKQTIKSTTNKH